MTRVPKTGGQPAVDSRDYERHSTVAVEEMSRPENIEIVNEVNANAEVFDLERFMNEPVTIHVPVQGKEGELQVVDPCVNGERAYVVRGQDATIKRKFVEVLLRAREANYEQQFIQSGADIHTPLKRTDALSYPVTIVNDTPRGRAWAREILAQRG